jgi:hypothetical protein
MSPDTEAPLAQDTQNAETRLSSQPTPLQSPAPSPTVPELSWLMLLPLCLIVLSVALVLKRHVASNSSKL